MRDLPADVARSILGVHNLHRRAFFADPLEWSEALSGAAASWAALCRFEHSPYPYGENLALGYSRPFQGDAAGQAAFLSELWFSREVCAYDVLRPEMSRSTGHFTQMVWRATSIVGCAIVDGSTCPEGILDPVSGFVFRDVSMLVCEYHPAGNWPGGYATNVVRPDPRAPTGERGDCRAPEAGKRKLGQQGSSSPARERSSATE